MVEYNCLPDSVAAEEDITKLSMPVISYFTVIVRILTPLLTQLETTDTCIILI